MRYKLGDDSSFYSETNTVLDTDGCRSYRGMDKGVSESYTDACSCVSRPPVYTVDETKLVCLATTEMLGRYGDDGWGCPPQARKTFNLEV